MQKTTFILILSLLLASCGFKLRGSEQPVFVNPNITLNVSHSKQNRLLKKKIMQQLTVLGASVTDIKQVNASPQKNLSGQVLLDNTQVNIVNIKLRKHRLVGRLTEIQLLLTADVIISSNTKTTRQRQLHIQRSYQYDQATVSTKDAEEARIVSLMHEEMASKISQQIALFESTSVDKNQS